jgi:7-cyano-7-deazaguanine synthase
VSEKIALLFSGGVESTILLYHYLEQGFTIYPVSILGGFKYEEIEKIHAENIWNSFNKKYPNQLKKIKIINFDWRTKERKGRPQNPEETSIPLRNLLLVSHVALYMNEVGIEKVGSGILGYDSYPDASKKYFKQIQHLIRTGLENNFEILTPLIGLSKEEILQKYNNKVDFSKTYSCVSIYEYQHCGVCHKCLGRKSAFKKAKVFDLTHYEGQPQRAVL